MSNLDNSYRPTPPSETKEFTYTARMPNSIQLEVFKSSRLKGGLFKKEWVRSKCASVTVTNVQFPVFIPSLRILARSYINAEWNDVKVTSHGIDISMYDELWCDGICIFAKRNTQHKYEHQNVIGYNKNILRIEITFEER